MADDINPTWRIEREPASRVFLELADAIRLDPKLKQHVRTWIIPERGEGVRAGVVGDPKLTLTAADCPAIDLWPEPRDGQARDNISQQATLTVQVTVIMPGFNPLDALDFWGRVQRAVLRDTLPDGSRLAVRLRQAGGTGEPVRIDQPGISRGPDRDGSMLVVAEGSLSTTYEIPEGED